MHVKLNDLSILEPTPRLKLFDRSRNAKSPIFPSCSNKVFLKILRLYIFQAHNLVPQMSPTEPLTKALQWNRYSRRLNSPLAGIRSPELNETSDLASNMYWSTHNIYVFFWNNADFQGGACFKGCAHSSSMRPIRHYRC